MHHLLHLLAFCLLCLPSRGALVAITNWNGGSLKPLAVVVCMDGYKVEEQIEGFAHGQAAANGWLSDPLLDGLRDRLIVITVFGESVDSGASYEGRTVLNTLYGSTFNYRGFGERLLVATKGYQAIRDANELGFIGATVAIVANSTIYGGSGGNPVSASRAAMPELPRHEFGHNIAGLADEYTSAYPGWSCREHPNSSTNRINPPWLHITSSWISGSQYGCVADGQVFGRARSDCKMNHLGVAWCDVCRAHYRSVIIAATLPAPAKRPLGSMPFTLSLL